MFDRKRAIATPPMKLEVGETVYVCLQGSIVQRDGQQGDDGKANKMTQVQVIDLAQKPAKDQPRDIRTLTLGHVVMSSIQEIVGDETDGLALEITKLPKPDGKRFFQYEVYELTLPKGFDPLTSPSG